MKSRQMAPQEEEQCEREIREQYGASKREIRAFDSRGNLLNEKREQTEDGERSEEIQSLHAQAKRIVNSTGTLSGSDIRAANKLINRMEELLRQRGNRAALDVVARDGGFDDNHLPTGPMTTEEPFGGKLGYTSYRDLFGNRLDSGGFKSFREFAGAILSGGGDERLKRGGAELRAMGESVAEEGGFLVPTQFASEVFDSAVEQSIVLPRARIWPMTSNTLSVPAFEIGDHSSNLYGGVICYWKAEAGSLTNVTPGVRNIELSAKKLTSLAYASNEIDADVAGFSRYLTQILSNAMAWYADRSMLSDSSAGDGVGKPMSMFHGNNPARIEQTKETNQSADSVDYANLTKMFSRMYPEGMSRCTWVMHSSVIPEILGLSIAVGTAGSHYPAMSESNGIFRILSRPVIFSEKMSVLGDATDIGLADFSQYFVGLRGELQLVASPHVRFENDQQVWRGIMRIDAQSAWSESLTLEDGSTTVSPFIVLAERA